MRRLWVGAVLCLVLALPAIAGDEGEKGWFVGIEATALRPSGGVQDYTVLDPNADGNVEGTIRSLEYDYEMSPRVWFGRMNSDGSYYSLSWWNYDETATDSVTTTGTENLWDILYEADDADDQFAGTASASGMMDASLIDFGYSRPLTSSDKFSTRWNVGLRKAEIENVLTALYDDGATVETAILGAEAEGMGLTGGLSAMYKLNDKWMISGGSNYSFLSGEFESLTQMLNGATFETNLTGEKDGTFSIFEARCGVTYHGPEWLYLWLSWEFSQWNNVLQTNNFPDDVSAGFIDSQVDDVTWDGWTFGAGFTF